MVAHECSAVPELLLTLIVAPIAVGCSVWLLHRPRFCSQPPARFVPDQSICLSVSSIGAGLVKLLTLPGWEGFPNSRTESGLMRHLSLAQSLKLTEKN